jgi:hypothetical protein
VAPTARSRPPAFAILEWRDLGVSLQTKAAPQQVTRQDHVNPVHRGEILGDELHDDFRP